MFRKAQSPGRPRHRVERRESHRAEAGRQGIQGRPAFGIEPVPPDSIVDGAIIDGAAVADAIRRLFDEPQYQDEGGCRVAVGQRRHREEDHAADDDRRRARRIHLLGSRAVHPVRHPGRQSRLPDPRQRRRRRRQEQSTCSWWPRRKTRSPTTPASSRRPDGPPWWSTSTPSRCRTPTRSTTGRPDRRRRCCSIAGASATNINILQGDQSVFTRDISSAATRTPKRCSAS